MLLIQSASLCLEPQFPVLGFPSACVLALKLLLNVILALLKQQKLTGGQTRRLGKALLGPLL